LRKSFPQRDESEQARADENDAAGFRDGPSRAFGDAVVDDIERFRIGCVAAGKVEYQAAVLRNTERVQRVDLAR
jgi:hypothetical protein